MNMKTIKTILFTLLFAILIIASLTTCKKQISGCTSTTAINYDTKATKNNGTCIEPVNGCTDGTATNFNANANVNCCCNYTGNITFWANKNYGSSISVTVTVNSFVYIGFITKPYTGSFPSCTAYGCASFSSIPVGEWNYYAENSNGNYWSGKCLVIKNDCSDKLLY